MDKSENNARHRMIRIYQMLMKDSYAKHPLIITDILPRLEQEYGIETCRDSVREDLKAMCDRGLPVEKRLASQYQFYYDGHVVNIRGFLPFSIRIKSPHLVKLKETTVVSSAWPICTHRLIR